MKMNELWGIWNCIVICATMTFIVIAITKKLDVYVYVCTKIIAELPLFRDVQIAAMENIHFKMNWDLNVVHFICFNMLHVVV